MALQKYHTECSAQTYWIRTTINLSYLANQGVYYGSERDFLSSIHDRKFSVTRQDAHMVAHARRGKLYDNVCLKMYSSHTPSCAKLNRVHNLIFC